MGCWNVTCGLTNLPIRNNDEIVQIIVKGNGKISAIHSHYANDYFSPVGLPLYGTYNDYGAIEQVEEYTSPVLASFMLGFIKDYIVEQEQGENKYHDIEVKKEGLDFEKVSAAMHKNRLIIKDRQFILNEESPVGFDYKEVETLMMPMFFHRKAYDAFMKGKFDSWGIKERQDLVDIMDAKIKMFQNNGKNIHESMTEVQRMTFNYMRVDTLKAMALSEVERDNYFKNLKESLFVAGDKIIEPHEDLYNAMIDVIWMDHCLQALRKIWLPNTYSGSQSQEYEYYKLLTKITNDIIKDVEDEYDE